MTTREFINKEFGQSGRSKDCSSVHKDFDGNIYSYGYHYPLLFTINGRNIRNIRGYSNTTARHILWSRDIDAIDIHCPSGFRLGNDAWNLQDCKRGQLAYIESLQRQMESKKRKDTQVYKWLANDLSKAVNNLERLEVLAWVI